MLEKNKLLLFLIICLFYINADSVCDHEVFILELKQDLEDNGILDCLRVIKPPNGVIESPEQKNKRLAAQWDSSCAFESTYDWIPSLKKDFGITSLVDETGEQVDHNLPDQADMCEIIRAAIAGGYFNPITSDVTDIPMEILNFIDCPGSPDSFKICAVNGISYYKTDMWTIMLDSSYIKFNNIPDFSKVNDINDTGKPEVPADPGEPIDKSAIEAALRINSPSDLEMQRLIDSSKNFTPVDNKRPTDAWKRVYVLSSSFTKEGIQSNAGWNYFSSGNIEIKSNNDIFVLSYSMVSGYAPRSRLAVRLVLDDISQISTRMIQGYMDQPLITTAFVSQLQIGKHTIKTQYRVSAQLRLDIDQQEGENIVSGAIVIPKQGLFLRKVINPQEIQLYNDNTWSDFPNLFTSIKLTTSCYVLVLYNISMPGMLSHIVTRVDINTNPVFESRSIAGDSMYWGIHNSFVYKFMADVEYNIKIRYRTPYPSKSNPRVNDWEAQSLMILQLPEWVDYKPIIIDEEYTLNCEFSWSTFPKMDIDLELEEDKTIVFIYNIVLPLVEKKMTVAIFMNNLLVKKSVTSSSSTMYYKTLGYYPVSLTKGKYKIQLKYKTDACITYKPQTDWQNISLTVLDMN